MTVDGRTTAGEVAERLGGRLVGDASQVLRSIARLETAGPDDLSFLHRPSYREAARASRAGCVIVGSEQDLPERTVIVAEDPYRAFAEAMQLFHAGRTEEPGVHEAAWVDGTAEVHPSATVGPRAVVAARARVGARSVVRAGAVVSEDCAVGEDVLLHSGCVLLERTVVGDRVTIHAGAVLGSDGFGYSSGPDGHRKIPHEGCVVVEDDVEIGAGTCIDRAVLGETRIGAGTKIDNLVQVAHAVVVGPGSLLVAQSGVSGSTRLGKGCVLAGQAGVAGHLTLGDGARVAAKSAVFEDVEAGATVGGIPAVKLATWKRIAVSLTRLPELVRRVKRLEREGGTRPASGNPEKERS